MIQQAAEKDGWPTDSWNPRKHKPRSVLRKIIKILFLLVIFIDAIPVVTLSIYYFSEFRPHLPVIEKMVAEAPVVYKVPPKELVRVVKLVEGERKILRQVTSSLVSQQLGRMNIGKWHFHNIMWRFILGLRYDDDEIFTLWCCVFPYGEGLGLEEAAKYLYHRNLDQLNTEEFIFVVAYGRCPRCNKENPEAHQKRADSYIKRYYALYGEGN